MNPHRMAKFVDRHRVNIDYHAVLHQYNKHGLVFCDCWGKNWIEVYCGLSSR